MNCFSSILRSMLKLSTNAQSLAKKSEYPDDNRPALIMFEEVVIVDRFWTYVDPKYSFSLKLPRWWKPYIVVKRTNHPGDAQHAILFRFKYKGKVYQEVLGIYVFRMTLQQWRKKGYKDSPYVVLASRNGNTFAYLTPEELPSEFLDKTGNDFDYQKYGKQIRLIKRMVNDNVPKAVKTFRFIAK
ncbi:hypothetical protein FHS15_004404 [Paenibacillus castaneae]|nr:hypothetical protein [Paenibacillus castaneae]NIK79246.1 hypothetical protein [Paenibacillus castaneae]